MTSSFWILELYWDNNHFFTCSFRSSKQQTFIDGAQSDFSTWYVVFHWSLSQLAHHFPRVWARLHNCSICICISAARFQFHRHGTWFRFQFPYLSIYLTNCNLTSRNKFMLLSNITVHNYGGQHLNGSKIRSRKHVLCNYLYCYVQCIHHRTFIVQCQLTTTDRDRFIREGKRTRRNKEGNQNENDYLEGG